MRIHLRKNGIIVKNSKPLFYQHLAIRFGSIKLKNFLKNEL